jgi:hypothetical protein
MRDHAAIEELIALGALDGLDPSGQQELAAQRSDHGADCEECRRLESTYDEVAGRLAFAVEPAQIREGFEDELVTLAHGGENPKRVDDSPPSIAREREHRRFARPMRVLAGVVAAALVVGAGIGYLLAPNGDTAAKALEQIVRQQDARQVQLIGSASGTMKVVYAPSISSAVVVGSGLEEPPSGKAYELWAFHGQTPDSAGCFAPENGNVLDKVDADLSGADALAVTVESSACPSAPTTQPVRSAEL